MSSTTNPVSIASSTSAGAAGGSVINVSALVQQLVQATQAPQQALIAAQTTTVTTQISAVGTLKSALSSFQESLAALDSASSFNSQTANSSDTAAFTATLGAGTAPVGSYNVTISQLASAQQILSGPIAGSGGTGTSTGNTVIGNGTLQLSLGNSSFSVNITDANDTLSGIAQAINAASGNPGITATVLQGSDGAHLLLTSTQTGASNTISVSETDSGTALSALAYSGTATSNYTQETAAQDAQYSISGVPGSSPTNTVSDALAGVTLNLLGTTPTSTDSSGNVTHTPAQLSISTDTSAISANINAFVQAYNTLVGQFNSLGSYDAATNQAGPLTGNALLSGIKSQVQNQLYSIVNTGSSTYNSLASIGITTNSDGTLKLNGETLSAALSTNFSAVSQLFNGTQGIASGLNTLITTNLATSGAVTSASNTLIAKENSLTDQTNTLNKQMAALTASLTQQYSALNTLLSQLQSTSSYLTQAFASLPSNQKSSG